MQNITHLDNYKWECKPFTLKFDSLQRVVVVVIFTSNRAPLPLHFPSTNNNNNNFFISKLDFQNFIVFMSHIIRRTLFTDKRKNAKLLLLQQSVCSVNGSENGKWHTQCLLPATIILHCNEQTKNNSHNNVFIFQWFLLYKFVFKLKIKQSKQTIVDDSCILEEMRISSVHVVSCGTTGIVIKFLIMKPDMCRKKGFL